MSELSPHLFLLAGFAQAVLVEKFKFAALFEPLTPAEIRLLGEQESLGVMLSEAAIRAKHQPDRVAELIPKLNEQIEATRRAYVAAGQSFELMTTPARGRA